MKRDTKTIIIQIKDYVKNNPEATDMDIGLALNISLRLFYKCVKIIQAEDFCNPNEPI